MSGCKLSDGGKTPILCSLHFVHIIIALLYTPYLSAMHIKHLQKNLELECLNCGKKTCRKVSYHQCLLPFEIEYCNSRPCNDEHGKLKLKLCRACTVLMVPSAYFLMLYIYVLYSCSWIVCVDILAAIIYSSDFKRSLPLSPEPEGTCK